MPIMSLQGDAASDYFSLCTPPSPPAESHPDDAASDYFSLPTHPSPPAESHPHPFRSHSTENIHQSTRARANTASSKHTSYSYKHDRADSCVLNNKRGSIYGPNGGDGSYEILDDFVPPPVPSPIHPAFRSSPTERLGDAAVSGPVTPVKDYPVVASRPPLRPTISFGGESRMSYYSLASSVLEQKSKAVAAEEERQARRKREEERRAWRKCGCFAVLCLLRCVCGVDTTSLATALPMITLELNATAIQGFWIANSFLLASALFQPLFMRLSYVLGIKTSLLFGIILCTGGSIVSGLARSLTAIVVGRTLAGIGSGALSVLTQLTLHQLVRSGKLSRCERAISLIYWLGAAIGPILGGAVAQTVGWRYIFWISVAFGLLALLTLPFLLRLPSAEGFSWQALQKVDYMGWALLSGSIAPITLAISWGGSSYPWTSWHTMAPLIIGIVVLLFWIHYSRYRIDPILPISLFFRANAAAACFSTLVHGMIFAGVVYFVPLYLTVAKGLSPTIAGVALGSWTLSLVITALVVGAIVSSHGYRWAVWLGCALVTTGIGLTVLLRAKTATSISIPIGLLVSLALGMLYPSLSTAVQASATTDDETIHAAPLHSFCSMIGQTLGLAASSSVFLNQLRRMMATNIYLAGHAAKGAVALANLIYTMSAEQAGLRAELISAYVDALRWVWVLLSILAGVALFLSVWFLEDHSPPRRSRDRGQEKRAPHGSV